MPRFHTSFCFFMVPAPPPWQRLFAARSASFWPSPVTSHHLHLLPADGFRKTEQWPIQIQNCRQLDYAFGTCLVLSNPDQGMYRLS